RSHRLSLDERKRYRPGIVDAREELAKAEWLTGALLLLRVVAHQPLELQLPGDVARAITRLPQVEKLLERHQIAGRVGPSARRPLRMKPLGLPQALLVTVYVERRKATCRA